MAQFQEQVEQRLLAVPGVRAAAVALLLPLQLDTDMVFAIEGAGRPWYGGGRGPGAGPRGQPGYFDVLQIPLRRGRVFTARRPAARDSPPVVVIDEAAAARIRPGADPLGQRITLGPPSLPDPADTIPREIVGIVGDVRDVGTMPYPRRPCMCRWRSRTTLYTALVVRLLAFSVVVRGDSQPADLTRSAQQAIWSVDPQQPVSDVRPMREIVAQLLGPQRFNTTPPGALAALALVLAAIGLYGTVTHLVSQQTREIGVAWRSAPQGPASSAWSCARPWVWWPPVWPWGTVGALGATRSLQTLLTDISTSDPWVFVLAPALMFVVAVAAALRPALRAAGVDPVRALRAE